MELKLNIYEKKKVIKTYTAEAYDITFGTMEDLIDALGIDGLNTGNDIELIMIATKVIAGNKEIIKDLLKDIFDGLTDEEIKKTYVKDLATVLVKAVKYAIAEIGKGVNGKN